MLPVAWWIAGFVDRAELGYRSSRFGNRASPDGVDGLRTRFLFGPGHTIFLGTKHATTIL
jgi:hypothetical protein